jgi:uncharacterized YigZ family protein
MFALIQLSFRMIRESFKTIVSTTTAEIKIKGSRFLGEMHPVTSVDEAEQILAQRRKKYHDATHHCYAYRIGERAAQYRSSDDGEPQGTAGKPLMAILEYNDLTNVLLVVVRYFGGTKLGTGGLVRAYTEIARTVIQKGDVVTVPIRTRLKIAFPYTYTSGIMKIIAHHNLRILDTEYGDDCIVILAITPSLVDTVKSDLRDATAGNIQYSPESHEH